MKAIVYTSNAGSTAKYAKILGSKIDLPVYSADEAKGSLPAGSDIIYLGWIMASKIKGFKKSMKHYNIMAVCGVGMAKTGLQIEECRKSNSVPKIMPLFTLQGGFDINKLHGIYKFMMNTMINTVGKSLAEKTDRTADEDDMLDLMQHGGERVSEDNLKSVLDWYQEING